MAYGMIAFAAFMWGLIGFFVKGLSAAGFGAMEIVALRVTSAAVILLLIGLLYYRQHLKINLKDLPIFLGTGLMSIVFFNWCYFTAIEKMNIPVAAALLYTSPAFVITLSILFLKEKLSSRKLVAIVGTIVGAALVAGISLNQESSSFPASSILIGMGAGFGYALYSIFGKVALRKYHPFTLTFYTFLVSAVCLFPFFFTVNRPFVFLDGEVFFYTIGLGAFPTVLAYFAYSWGLEKVESSRAAIVATVEPVAAAFLGLFAYSEMISVHQLVGIILIIAAVIFVNIPKGNQLLKKEINSKSAP